MMNTAFTFRKRILLTIMLFILYNHTVCPCFAITYKGRIPSKVRNYVECKKSQTNCEKELKYIMNWHNYKVYSLQVVKRGINYYEPVYILYNGKDVHIPSIEETKILRFDMINYINDKNNKKYQILNSKLRKNSEKIMVLTNPQNNKEVTSDIIKYANKYMLKGKDRKIFYLMDWQNQHVYRVYWVRYGLLPVPASIIFSDGQTIRRPTKEEFKNMRKDMSDAMFEYINAQESPHNKD